jgi:hypothetical protein
MKRIQYDNFRTQVSDVATPDGLVRVLSITDHDASTTHEFAYPEDMARQVAAALAGTAVRTATPGDLAKITRPAA